MRKGPCHERVNDEGIGKCSVPMWCGGLPAGFCDAPAFGKQERGQRRYGEWSSAWGKWFDGYCSGLACYSHGGPQSRVFMDGHMWCAVYADFINLQESPAGFGETPDKAREDLSRQPKQARQKETP